MPNFSKQTEEINVIIVVVFVLFLGIFKVLQVWKSHRNYGIFGEIFKFMSLFNETLMQ